MTIRYNVYVFGDGHCAVGFEKPCGGTIFMARDSSGEFDEDFQVVHWCQFNPDEMDKAIALRNRLNAFNTVKIL